MNCIRPQHQQSFFDQLKIPLEISIAVADQKTIADHDRDGRKPFPIDHGSSSSDTFLEDAIEVVKKFMQRDPSELTFSMLALAAV